MRSTRKTLPLALGLAISLALNGTGRLAAQQEDEESDGFRLELDSLLMGPFFADVDTSSSKVEEYRDIDEEMTFGELRLTGQSKDGNRWLDFQGTNLVRDDARYELRYGLSGHYGLSIDHNVIPHRFGNAATLLYTQTRPGVFEISDSVQGRLQSELEAQFAKSRAGVNFAFLDRQLKPLIATADTLDIELKRRRTRVHFDLAKLSRFSLGLELKHETRSGARPYGGSLGFSNVTEMPEPIDYDTIGTEISGEWRGKRAGLRVGYRYSSFQNHIESLRYDNPFRLTDSTDGAAYLAPGSSSINGPSVSQNALAPDNSASDLYATGRTKLGDKGWASGSLSYTYMKQDAALLPYSTNRAINAASGAPFDVTELGSLPASRFDGDVRALNLTANAGYRLGRKATLQVRLRRYDYDNQSGRLEFPGYVRFDSVWEEIPRINVPYGYTRLSLGADLSYELGRGSRVGVGYERENWDRTFREISESHDDILKVSFDTRAWERLMLRAAYRHGDRNTDEYRTDAQELSFLHPEGINNQPGLRKFDEAARTFNDGSFLATLAFNDKADFQLGLRSRKDDYHASPMGLLYDKHWALNAELSYSPRPDISLIAFGNRTDRTSFQRARQSGGTLSTSVLDDWELTLEEVTDTLGAGLSAKLAQRWKADLALNWTRADGNTLFFSPPGGTPDRAVGFDEYDDNEFLGASAQLEYLFNERIAAGFRYWREDYTTDPFARSGLVPYLPGSLLLVPNDGDYVANLFLLSLRVSF